MDLVGVLTHPFLFTGQILLNTYGMIPFLYPYSNTFLISTWNDDFVISLLTLFILFWFVLLFGRTGQIPTYILFENAVEVARLPEFSYTEAFVPTIRKVFSFHVS